MFDCPQNLREEEMFEVPEWAANKVVYQIFPSRYAASQPVDKELWYKAPITFTDNLHGDIRGIIDHLDYIRNLGIDVIYLTPIFKSDSSHKYDTIDYYQIDPSFGTAEDLRELVQKAHQYGMKVVLDAVFNHTGRDFLHLRTSLKIKKSPNIWTGILLINSRLIMNPDRHQISNVLAIIAECRSLILKTLRLKNMLQMLHAIGSKNAILMDGEWM